MFATRSFVGLLALVVLASLAQAAQLAVGGPPLGLPTATMTADGIPYDVPLLHRPGPPPGVPGLPDGVPGGPPDGSPGHYVVGYVDDFGNEIEGYVIDRTGEWHCTIRGVIDPDPSIAYTAAVTDFAAPSTFTFFFSTPIVPTGPTTIVDASIVGSIRDATGDGVTITPAMPDMDGDGIPEIQFNEIGGPITNMGVDVGLLETHGAGPVGEVYPYGSHAAGPVAGPAGTWTTLQTTASFMLSGSSDSAALTGFAQVVVPEPNTFALAGIGALLLVGYAIRRRKA